MSYLLWKYFYNDEIDRFRNLLANASHHPQYSSKGHGGTAAQGLGGGSLAGSPGGAFSISPRTVKNRKTSGQIGMGTKGMSHILSRSDVNSRDYAGVPLLGRIASSKSESAIDFGLALIEHPAIDLCVQDLESGWTPLHRALYFGNITLARAIVERDSQIGRETAVTQKAAISVIKVKDHEGNSPFDVYNATIARQSLNKRNNDSDSDDDEEEAEDPRSEAVNKQPTSINGDELFAWGSSKNYNLGFGDEDDRQHPEKITLKRPDHLLFRFYREYLENTSSTDEAMHIRLSKKTPKSVADLPALISSRPIVFQDVSLSKLHSAIITTDPESNLYVCGYGPGGRLGTGDERTRFSYVCVESGGLAGKKVVQVALGHNHTLAVDSEGETFSWGQSSYGVLGYSLPRVAQEQEPFCHTPRQIFGPLKREFVIGVAASAIHSVAYTSTSLFTWGKNEGQLGLMDSDSRSLEIQSIARKVGASLFKAPIAMVSAINRATIVLLENHSVCVFTNYGYNFVKFPPNEILRKNALTTRYDTEYQNITNITAAGDTIAAFSTESLFTINVRQTETSSTTSTTNPSKILRDSLTPAQRVWSLRKGHWDGIKSASVTGNGSVIVCTQAGAVWQRVKHSKVKDTFSSPGTFHRKDFKFKRIPGLTNVAAVRSTAFGVYAAIRKDCDVTKTQITVEEQALWKDINPLLSLHNLEVVPQNTEDDAPRFWAPVLPNDLLEPLKRAVLTARDLEADVSHHLLRQEENKYDFEVCTTISEVRIPVHGFMLGRSSVLRDAIGKFRSHGKNVIPDVLTTTIEPATGSGRTRITFQGLDFITIVNLVIYIYTDTVVDVWHYTSHFPQFAFRFRQVRVELMKTATHLRLAGLESAVRLMTATSRRLNLDISLAIQDNTFFEDGDVIIELDESEVFAHSELLCQRCAFFEGLFNGRARGQWLASRRIDNSEAVRIDFKHISLNAFQYVVRYLYADVGLELFDDVVADDIDEFSDLVMDVMAVANELMLDRLSQICQQVIGRFVNTRNVCNLVNAVAPCSVTEFKEKALEYLCLQLESMLANNWLYDLDEDLLLELDCVVQANQLACLPFAKSERAELLLHKHNPTLAEDIDEERRRRYRDMAFRANLRAEENRLSSLARARYGSLEDAMGRSPSQEKARRKSKATRNEPFSPVIRPKDSTVDLMFDMEEDTVLPLAYSKSPFSSERVENESSTKKWENVEPGTPPEDEPVSSLPAISPHPARLSRTPEASSSTGKGWSSPNLPSSKLGLREIMAQASSNHTSNLSISLSAQKAQDTMNKTGLSKLSQKERKKQQQKAQLDFSPNTNVEKVDEKKPSSPWQIAKTGLKTSLKDVLGDHTPLPIASTPKSLRSPAPARPAATRHSASPGTRFSSQQRNASSDNPAKGPSVSRISRPAEPSTKSSPVIPHSKSYKAPPSKAEPSLQLSMADIIGQQRREQEVIKEAVAKRSLQEIQEEQAFQEWWDQESQRAQEAEASRVKPTCSSGRGGKSGSGRGKGANRGRGRGRGGRGRGDSLLIRGRGRDQGHETLT